MSKLIARNVPAARPPAGRPFSRGPPPVRERSPEPLSPEDQTVQSMPDASPTKWHLAHTTWFFETFVLRPHLPAYRPFDPAYEYLFNSYYEAVGPRHPRPQRGMITRPGVEEILAYRRHVTEAPWRELIGSGRGDWAAICRARAAPRAAASGADPDGCQAHAVDEPVVPGLCAGERGAGATTGRRSAGSISRAGWSRSAMPARRLRLRQRGPAPSHRGSIRSRWRRGW